jgi:uncharacterized protein YndB with AHSA1/START domain
MSTTRGISKTILIRESRQRVFAGLTQADDLDSWFGGISPDRQALTGLEGEVWRLDGSRPITIRGTVQGTRIVLSWPVSDPGDLDGNPLTTIASFDIRPMGHSPADHPATLLSVNHQGFPMDEAWDRTAALYDNRWVTDLVYLQLWLESGRSRAETNDAARFTNVTGSIRIAATPEQVFQAFVTPSSLQGWIGGTIEMDAFPGGRMDVQWETGDHVGGEVVLIDQPRHIVWHWWDAQKLAIEDDPGLVTIMIWTLTDAEGYTEVSLIDMGYDRSIVDDTYVFDINQGWGLMLAALPCVVYQCPPAETLCPPE